MGIRSSLSLLEGRLGNTLRIELLVERHGNTLRLALPEEGNGNTLRLEFTVRKAWEYAQA